MILVFCYQADGYACRIDFIQSLNEIGMKKFRFYVKMQLYNRKPYETETKLLLLVISARDVSVLCSMCVAEVLCVVHDQGTGQVRPVQRWLLLR